MKSADDLTVIGALDVASLSASFKRVTTFPASPKWGQIIFYEPDGALYYRTDTKWEKIATVGGTGSYYSIALVKVVAIEDGAAMNLLMNLTLDGTIILDGAIADSVS